MPTRIPALCLAIAALFATSLPAQAQAAEKKIEVKVVVLAMFEAGADSGDTPGEYQYWVERNHLNHIYPFPQGNHDLRMNDDGVLGVLTGVATARATATVMALGLDPRFDLSHAYWLVAGIAGINPERGSLGSAVWPEWLVDGDLAHEIDSREIPAGWTTGYVPLRKSMPYEQPRTDDNGIVFHLSPELVNWAYQLTKDTPLDDNPTLRARRMEFAGAAAHQPPSVIRGDEISASTFWHGKLMSQWASDWVSYQTNGAGHYTVCGMEDTGTLQSLTWLARAGKVDLRRVLVLRTASNFDQQRTGLTAAQSLAETKVVSYIAYLPALEAAWRVGNRVVTELTTHWSTYRDHLPTESAAH